MILLSPVVIPIAAIGLPLFVLPLWICYKLETWQRARNAANPKRTWFAWRPVHFSAFWEEDMADQWLWLERVDAIWRGHAWEYRPLGFVSQYDD